ncbi:nitrite reductase small subunit NirD [Halothiobacillus sp. DCM-1]|uniref:nitrite reductase small subunit NirD n=1 Tax=Halothiobacillus sp. DCM-1 TaxID=3112558 RepID=UPI0032507420
MHTTWYPVGALDAIPRRSAKVVRLHGTPVAIFRTQDDHLFALEDRCPHKHGPLSQGIVHDNGVTCPLHSWVIRFDTGHAVAPDVGCTARYPVRLHQAQIEIGYPPLPALDPNEHLPRLDDFPAQETVSA